MDLIAREGHCRFTVCDSVIQNIHYLKVREGLQHVKRKHQQLPPISKAPKCSCGPALTNFRGRTETKMLLFAHYEQTFK